MIENYTLTREQAEQIPMFYHPELAVADLPRGMSHPEHDLGLFPPTFKCKIEPGLKCSLKLRRDAPLIESAEIEADSDEEFRLGKKRLEKIFGFELKHGRQN